MPRLDRHPNRARILAALAIVTLLGITDGLTPQRAAADIYTYRKPDGSLVVSTTPRKGLTLVEHIRDDSGSDNSGGGGRRKKVSAKHQRSREIAEQRLARSTAKRRAPVANRENMYDDYIREAAQTYQIPFAFIKGVIKVESNFYPTVISRTGAMGLMQLMPATADYLGVKDAFDPRQNIFGGAKLLRLLTNRYNGDINLLLSAYNAGEGAVDRYDGIPYTKTREYVRRVYQHYKRYQSQEQGDYSTPTTETEPR
ncbi:MAG: lytic transglycosylase domain-containing protein [Myxococcota bacterium]